MTSNVSCRLRHGYPMSSSLWRCHRSVHRQSSGHSCCAWKMVTRSRYVFMKMVISNLPRGLCVPEAGDVRIERIPWMGLTTVISREKLALKSFDVVDETRAKLT